MSEDVQGQLGRWLADGQEALEAGRYSAAAQSFASAAAALPSEWPLHQMTANAWRLARDVVRERDALRTAFEVGRPTDIEQLYQLGASLLDTGAPTEARVCFAAVVARRPRDPAALGALASALRAEGQPEAAWPLARRALTLAHKMPSLLLTAAQVRHALGDTAGARAWLAKAEKVRPGHPLQQIQWAFSYLLDGPCAAGWAAFEARGLPVATTGARDWHGESIEGQSIAVLMEQGIGDLFHFVRYTRRLDERGASRVIVECPPSAVTLLTASGFDVVPTGALPVTDWSVPLLSLPHRLGSDTDTVNELVPYLSVGARLNPLPSRSAGRPRVGVVFKGNPAFLSTVLRDLSTSGLEALTALRSVDWVSLQFGDTVPEKVKSLVSVCELNGCWIDTAHLLSSLDLVVSVDTATAHLAGALGVPAIVLLPFAPDWRWGLGTDQSIWYPTVRLARQTESADWRGAVAAAHRLIGEMIPPAVS